MRHLFATIFDRKASLRRKFTHLQPYDEDHPWIRKSGSSPLLPPNHVNAKALADCLDYLIDNTFVTFGNAIFQQNIGIPMGTNCAVFLANYFLFTYELEFASKLIDQDRLEELRHFSHTFRYIDDVLPLNNPHFSTLFSDIYPQETLTLNKESDANSVTFLDIRITLRASRNRAYHTTVFDKRTLPKYKLLPMTRYPHATSFVPPRFGLNIVTSQCFRFLRRCMSRNSFIFNLAKVVLELSYKQFSLRKLLSYAHRFFKRSLPLLYKAPSAFFLTRKLKHRIKLLQHDPQHRAILPAVRPPV